MTIIDVFNGDADGLCALHQLRLADPQNSVLVTGVKRDISLVSQIGGQVDTGPGDRVTVLDVSLEKNREALVDVLESGATVRYMDHHYPGDMLEHKNLDTYIDTSAETCTGLIVNKYLHGEYLPWAVTAAYGDNLDVTAEKAAADLKLTSENLALLKSLGTLLNYNGYGFSIDDLYFPPAVLYKRVQPHRDPFTFINEDEAFVRLKQGYDNDRERAKAIKPEILESNIAIYIFPNDPFARRVSGVYANELAQKNPQRAHALLSELSGGHYLVSVRAPLCNRTGADELCRQFKTGGGRKAAAGINHLPAVDLERFAIAMKKQFAD